MVGLVIALGACGGDHSPATEDGGTGTDGGSNQPPPPSETFTAFVTDLINNHTADDTQPVAYESFATLPDPGTSCAMLPEMRLSSSAWMS